MGLGSLEVHEPMKDNKKLNISSTPYRVLTILQLLNMNAYTLDELVKFLSKNKIIARTFSKDVILKYINTLRLSGYEITRSSCQNPQYHLRKAPFLLDLTEDEIKTLAITQNFVKDLYRPHLNSSFESCIKKIGRFIKDEEKEKLENYSKTLVKSSKQNFKQYANLIKFLERCCIENQTIVITYSPLEGLIQKIIFEPNKIEYKNQKVYITGNNPKISQTQQLQFDYIKELKQLPSKSRNLNYDSHVTFKLVGRLAKSYRPYEREKIINKDPGTSSIIIQANVGDIDALLHRLLRYGQYCEVLAPFSTRKRMKEIIGEIIEMYAKKKEFAS